MAEQIITMFIFLITALIMVIIGVSNLKSKSPVGFYTGVKAPNEEDVTDVLTWNKKHGYMWIIYGIVIVITGIIVTMYSKDESTASTLIILLVSALGVVLPIICMMIYHSKLEKQYRINH